MAIYTISDVHGGLFWKDVVNRTAPNDHIVFLGDYFDRRGDGPFAPDMRKNFLDICEFARARGKTHLLIGNHDFQYTPWDPIGCGGRDDRRAPQYMQALMDNIDLLDVVWPGYGLDEPVLFSHAGISADWIKLVGIAEVSQINSAWKADRTILDVWEKGPGNIEWHGDNVWQSPIWIRPNALIEGAVAGWNQVVGHSPVPGIVETKTIHGNKIWITCTFDDNILVLE